MFTRLMLVLATLTATQVAGASARIYAVTWSQGGTLIDQVDRQLRDELRRRGATVIEGDASRAAIVLKPSLEVFPGALKLSVIGVRNPDHKLLGAISTKASGASQQALVKALVSRTCSEAAQLE